MKKTTLVVFGIFLGLASAGLTHTAFAKPKKRRPDGSRFKVFSGQAVDGIEVLDANGKCWNWIPSTTTGKPVASECQE